MKLQLLKTDYFTKDRSAGRIHAGQYSKELHNLSICLEHSPPSCRWHIWYMCQPQLHRTLQHELLVYKPLLHRFLQQDLQCHVWKTPLREEKVNWFRVWRTPAPPPLKLWRISSRDMSGVVMFPPSLLNSPEGQQKLRAAQQQQHLLTVWGHRLMSSPPPRPNHPGTQSLSSTFHSRNTGIHAWMRWKQLSLIVQDKSSTSSLESGTRPFTAASHPWPHVSGKPVRWVSSLMHQ